MFAGQLNVFPVMFRYVVELSTNPRRTCTPPPILDMMEVTLYFNYRWTSVTML